MTEAPEIPRPGGDETPDDLAPSGDAAAAAESAAPEIVVPESAAGGEVPESPAESAALLRDRWLRAEADLQNFRRRAQREREETRRAAEESVLLEVIAMLDDLERALDASREASAPPGWAQGVELVAARARESLARFGVTRLDPAGERFDPRFHDALMEMDAPEGVAPGTVLQVVERGYARGDRALRAARVVVARHPEGG